MPTTRIDATPYSGSRLGLLASARIQVDGSDVETLADGQSVRWIAGMRWQPNDCAGGTILDPCGTTGPDASPTGEADRAFTPFVVEASVECLTFGSSQADLEAQARAKLVAVQQRKIEAELWAGTLAQAASWSNAYLTDGNADLIEGGTPLGSVTALAELEQAIADSLSGQGMIHATPRTVTHWLDAGLVSRTGNLLLTALDTIVVPGRGYAGTAHSADPKPTGGSADFDWAYATDPVVVRLGQIDLAQTTGPAGLDRTNNLFLLTATRFAAATFDGCLHVGALVDHRSERTTTGS